MGLAGAVLHAVLREPGRIRNHSQSHRIDTRIQSHRAALGAFVGAATVALCLSFTALSGGAPLAPLKFAYLTIPHNQGWYFGAPPNRSIGVDGFTREVRLFLGAIVVMFAAWILAVVAFR